MKNPALLKYELLSSQETVLTCSVCGKALQPIDVMLPSGSRDKFKGSGYWVCCTPPRETPDLLRALMDAEMTKMQAVCLLDAIVRDTRGGPLDPADEADIEEQARIERAEAWAQISEHERIQIRATVALGAPLIPGGIVERACHRAALRLIYENWKAARRSASDEPNA